jgi:hypothetical protein
MNHHAIKRKATMRVCMTKLEPANDIEFSGERKRVRCNEVLGAGYLYPLREGASQCRAELLSGRIVLATDGVHDERAPEIRGLPTRLGEKCMQVPRRDMKREAVTGS